jgi:hypothetical protein
MVADCQMRNFIRQLKRVFAAISPQKQSKGHQYC